MSTETAATKKFLGKYRAVVTNNVDPLFIGRIQVIVPDVASLVPSTWAMPSTARSRPPPS